VAYCPDELDYSGGSVREFHPSSHLGFLFLPRPYGIEETVSIMIWFIGKSRL